MKESLLNRHRKGGDNALLINMGKKLFPKNIFKLFELA